MTNTHRSFLVGALILGLVVIMWIARPDGSAVVPPDSLATASGGTDLLTAEETAFNFGTISMKQGVVTHDFAITNTSPEPIIATKLSTSCMCTEATLITPSASEGPFGMEGHGGSVPRLNASLLPNEAATIRVAFDPAAHGPAGIGKISRIVTLKLASGANLVLSISANVTP